MQIPRKLEEITGVAGGKNRPYIVNHITSYYRMSIDTYIFMSVAIRTLAATENGTAQALSNRMIPCTEPGGSSGTVLNELWGCERETYEVQTAQK